MGNNTFFLIFQDTDCVNKHESFATESSHWTLDSRPLPSENETKKIQEKFPKLDQKLKLSLDLLYFQVHNSKNCFSWKSQFSHRANLTEHQGQISSSFV